VQVGRVNGHPNAFAMAIPVDAAMSGFPGGAAPSSASSSSPSSSSQSDPKRDLFSATMENIFDVLKEHKSDPETQGKLVFIHDLREIASSPAKNIAFTKTLNKATRDRNNVVRVSTPKNSFFFFELKGRIDHCRRSCHEPRRVCRHGQQPTDVAWHGHLQVCTYFVTQKKRCFLKAQAIAGGQDSDDLNEDEDEDDDEEDDEDEEEQAADRAHDLLKKAWKVSSFFVCFFPFKK